MLKIDEKTHFADITLFNEMEAKIFIVFLESEKIRHQEDIEEIEKKILYVKQLYNITQS